MRDGVCRFESPELSALMQERDDPRCHVSASARFSGNAADADAAEQLHPHLLTLRRHCSETLKMKGGGEEGEGRSDQRRSDHPRSSFFILYPSPLILSPHVLPHPILSPPGSLFSSLAGVQPSATICRLHTHLIPIIIDAFDQEAGLAC